MAEAMAVAGLASSIITFVEFGVKLAKLTKQVYDAHGELPKDLQKCQSTVDEFSDWVRNLKTRQDTADLPLTRGELSLKNALDHCINDCDELLKILESLLSNVTPGKASLKVAVRALKKEGRIGRIQRSLENHKNELRLRIAERTMEMVEETRDTGSTHLSVTRSIERHQVEFQGENNRMGAGIKNIQQSNHNEVRGMFGEMTRLQFSGQQENRELGNNLMDMQMAGQNEIVACIAQHNQRFNQIHNSLGLMELDLEGIKTAGDDTLLLVKQLANAVNATGDGSFAIYIRVPRALYDPALSMWNGYRAYVEKGKQLQMPGGWGPILLNHVQDQQLGKFSGSDARAAYVAVSTAVHDLEHGIWTRNLVGPTWSMQDFERAYDKKQSWLSYFFCYDIVGIRSVPLLRDSSVLETDGDPVYKTWSQMVRGHEMLEDGTVIVDDEAVNVDEAERLRLAVGKANMHTDVEVISSSIDPVIGPEIGIRRRDTIPKDVSVEASDLNSWIQSIEEDYLQKSRELKPFIAVNDKLQSIPSMPENSPAIKRNIDQMVRHFEERATFEMPELVQMMTTELGSDADKRGAFKWGFQVMVARNEVNFQLLIFALLLAIIVLYDRVSPAPYRNIGSIFHYALCAAVDESSSFFVLFSLRLLLSWFAVQSWLFHSDCLIWIARRFDVPNVAWEDAIKKPTRRGSQQASTKIYAAVLIGAFMSCSKTCLSFFGTGLERFLCFGWLAFLYLIVVSSFWSAKDWFMLHKNPSLRVYRLGALLSAVLSTSVVLSFLQSRARGK